MSYDDVINDNAATLADAVVGHRIQSVTSGRPGYGAITLDDGSTVYLDATDDCCAYTELEAFLLNPSLVDHVITGVRTNKDGTTWHVYADMGDVLALTVGWSEGNGYYGYGFNIHVR